MIRHSDRSPKIIFLLCFCLKKDISTKGHKGQKKNYVSYVLLSKNMFLLCFCLKTRPLLCGFSLYDPPQLYHSIKPRRLCQINYDTASSSLL